MKISSMKYELRRKKTHNDENPLEMMVNLMDIMLVFACGLMLALIINWNLDIDVKQVDYNMGKEVIKTEMDISDSEGQLDIEQKYTKMGTVYKDPQTGKTYIVTEK